MSKQLGFKFTKSKVQGKGGKWIALSRGKVITEKHALNVVNLVGKILKASPLWGAMNSDEQRQLIIATSRTYLGLDRKVA